MPFRIPSGAEAQYLFCGVCGLAEAMPLLRNHGFLGFQQPPKNRALSKPRVDPVKQKAGHGAVGDALVNPS